MPRTDREGRWGCGCGGGHPSVPSLRVEIPGEILGAPAVRMAILDSIARGMTDRGMWASLTAALAATPRVTYEDVSDGVVAATQRHLSAADVEAAIAFYSTEAGERLRQHLPAILREANIHSTQIVKQKLQAYSDALNRTLMNFQNEMDQRKPHPHSGGGEGDSSQTMHTGTI